MKQGSSDLVTLINKIRGIFRNFSNHNKWFSSSYPCGVALVWLGEDYKIKCIKFIVCVFSVELSRFLECKSHSLQPVTSACGSLHIYGKLFRLKTFNFALGVDRENNLQWVCLSCICVKIKLCWPHALKRRRRWKQWLSSWWRWIKIL